MSPIILAGTTIVTCALIFYAIGIITEQRRHRVTNVAIGFVSIGLVCDITATICMIIGSSQSGLTPHAFLGYSSLLGMLIDATLLWRWRLRHGQAQVPRGLHLYSRYAFTWWVLAYITGGILVALRSSAS